MTAPRRWRPYAACRGLPLSLFFLPGSVDDAKQVCAGCPVIGQCGEWAVTHGEVGVWGGMTDDERVEIRKERRRARVQMLPSIDDDTPRVCTICGQKKPADQFSRRHDNQAKLRTTCRSCQKESYLRWYTERNSAGVRG